MLSLNDVLAATGGQLRGGTDTSRTLVFQRVEIDSRRVVEGALFVALRGQKHDGHAFVAQALATGATGALVEEVPADCLWAEDPAAEGPPLVIVPSCQGALEALVRFVLARHPQLEKVGITGSLGKTTTKEVAAGLLAHTRRVLKSEGNLNSEIGLPLTILNQLTDEHEVAVLEMGMYDLGDIRLLARMIQPRVGVVTAVQPVHLERLGNMDRIRQAKQELVEELPSNGVAILNVDDPAVQMMAGATPARVLWYGVSPEAGVRADEINSQGLKGVEFTLIVNGDRQRAHLPLLGAHSVHAALAAVAIALEEGLTPSEAVEGLQSLSPALRLLVVEGINGSRIIDDSYNASTESVLAALNLLRELPGRRKIAVLGDMLELGSEEEPGHGRVGNRAARVVDLLVTYGERARQIAAEARGAGLPPDQIVETESIDEIARLLARRLRPGDDVLVKGSRSMGLEAVVQAIRATGER